MQDSPQWPTREREIHNLTRAIAIGGELAPLITELGSYEKRRIDLRSAIEGCERVQEQRIDQASLEAAVRRRVDDCGPCWPAARCTGGSC